MKNFLLVTTLILLSACSTREYRLETTEFNAPNAATFDVVFFKTKSKGFDVSLYVSKLAANTAIIIKKDEIACGRGEKGGSIRFAGILGSFSDTVLLGESSGELHVYCGYGNLHNVEGKYYVKFKNIYSSTPDGEPDKVLASDVRFDLK